MGLVDVGELWKGSEFKVFTDWANADDGRVVALRAPGAASLSRKQIYELAAHAAKYGAKGLAGMKVEDAGKGRDGINSPIAKFLDDATPAALVPAARAHAGDLLLFVSSTYHVARPFTDGAGHTPGTDRRPR